MRTGRPASKISVAEYLTPKIASTMEPKRLFTLSMLCFLTLVSMAQARFGVVAGATFFNMHFYDGIDYATEHKTGFAAGCMLDVPLGRKVSFSPELAYRQKGYVEVPREQFTWLDYRYRWTFDNLDMSMMFRFYPKETLRGVHLGIGPSVSWLMGARVRDVNADPYSPLRPTSSLVQPVDAVDPDWMGFNILDIGLSAAFGADFGVGKSRLGVEYRYQFGLNNVHNGFTVIDVQGATVGRVNSKNRGMMLQLAWLLPVGDGRTEVLTK